MTQDDWRPTGSLEHLRQRARMLAAIRRFFDELDIIEVDTPLLCHGIGTDPQLAFFSTELYFYPNRETLYLQTSPEFSMKRLLAAGYGSIYKFVRLSETASPAVFIIRSSPCSNGIESVSIYFN